MRSMFDGPVVDEYVHFCSTGYRNFFWAPGYSVSHDPADLEQNLYMPLRNKMN